jgi:hypothetical protein
VAAGVYFAPEAHAAYEAVGFDGSRVVQDGVARPNMKAYFPSRGACMGQVSGEVVAAAFGCFNPKVVVPAVDAGWQIADREAILEARQQGATAMLQRILGEQPEGLARVADLLRRAADAAPWAGRGLYSGLHSLGFPASRWVTCDGPRTWCASTAVTATSSPGRSSAQTRWRSCC